MPERVVAVVAWVALVAALAVYVTVSGPARNDTVYRYHTEVAAGVEVVDPAFDVTAAGVSSRQLQDVELWGPAAGGVVVTVTPTTHMPDGYVAIDTDAATVTGRGDHALGVATVQGSDVLEMGIPTVVALAVEPPVDVLDEGYSFVATNPTVPMVATVPLLVAGELIATVTVQLIPIAVTGDDLGIAGTIDIPDQRLPRPAVGEAIPTQLDDGRPVWVIGLDQDVAVLDARSPHRHSGLVGWCGSMPGFIDSIGGSRFTAAGEYRFGPAPHGLVPYAVEIGDDHVVVTHRLPARPHPLTSTTVAGRFPPIEGSPIEQGGYCDIDGDLALQAHEDGAFLEDFRGDPSWVQHDLADWPALDGATGDGWFRTGEHRLADGGPHLVGDLLVHRERGVIVDAASPPGTARSLYGSGPAEPTMLTRRYVQTVRADDGTRSIAVQRGIWVTPTGIFPADAPPDDPDRHLAPTAPSTAHPLADEVVVPADPGDVVTLTVVDGQVTGITTVGSR